MILFLTDESPDYGADYLYDGFCDLLGPDRVVDWPPKPSLHGVINGFDCDLNWPNCHEAFEINGQSFDLSQLSDALRSRLFEAIVIPTLRGKTPKTLTTHAELLKLNRDRVVFYHAEDRALDVLPYFVDLVGFEPALYYRREILSDENTRALALPFGYPGYRVSAVTPRKPSVIYAAHVWPWAKNGTRDKIAASLPRAAARIPGATCTVTTSSDEKPERPSVAQYHDLNRRHLIAVSPAGAGYGTNRHLEIIADGCCPVIERPWVRWPDAPTEGVHCRFFRDAQEACDQVETMLLAPERARRMAQDAQAWLLAHHTTRRRAQTVLSDLSCGGAAR